MARSLGTSIENNFVRGMISEATGLNFPENACTETENCIFKQTGKVQRRKGFRVEDNSVPINYNDYSSGDGVVSEYVWESVAGRGDITFVVLQIGNFLLFFQPEENSLSSGKKNFSVDLRSFSAGNTSQIELYPVQLTSGNGSLFVTHRYCEPFKVNYNPSTDSISTDIIFVRVRDIEGLNDGLNTDARPASLGDYHKYNLLNQGWGGYVETTLGVLDPIAYWNNRRGDYPSNADIWWVYKDSDDKFDISYVNRIYTGNSPTPRGKFILDAFNKNRSSVSGLYGIPNEGSGYERPQTVAFHAGRVFYGGCGADNYNSRIFFSQILDTAGKEGKCYQINDPTSENLSDALPTDGGVIVIPEIGTLFKMVPLGTDLFVFASNGVWSISGNSGIGFTANDYAIKKVSSVPCVSSSSFVIVNYLPLWWNYDGIYGLQIDPVTQSASVQSLIDTSIRQFFVNIPSTGKQYAKGSYNPVTKVVQWLYESGDKGFSFYYYDKILNFNTTTGAFYLWTAPNNDEKPVISGIICTKGFTNSTVNEIVEISTGEDVVNSDDEEVVVSYATRVPVSSNFFYITYDPRTVDILFALENADTYLDFGEIDYSSYLVTGYKIHADAIRKFQTNYVMVFCEQEANSSLMFSARRSFANSGDSGKYSSVQQAYKADSNYAVTYRRLKVLGTGNVVQFECRSETGKPFNLIGYSVFETANQLP